MRCLECKNLNQSELSRCSTGCLTELHFGNDPTIIAEKAYLFKEGDPVTGIYCVSSGLVLIEKGKTEHSYALRLAGEGSLVGISSVLSGSTYQHSALAVEPVSACFMDKQEALNLLQKNPAFYASVMQSLCKDLDLIEKRMSLITTQNTSKRVAELLLMFWQSYNAAVEAVFDIRLEPDDFARLTGTSAKNLGKIFGQFKENGWIKHEKDLRLAILQPQALSHFVQC